MDPGSKGFVTLHCVQLTKPKGQDDSPIFLEIRITYKTVHSFMWKVQKVRFPMRKVHLL
jgi:hypothetical protein